MSGVESGIRIWDMTKNFPSTYEAFENIDVFQTDENNLYFNFGGSQAVARVSKYEISQIGDRINFVFMPSKMHFFDKETGVNYAEL